MFARMYNTYVGSIDTDDFALIIWRDKYTDDPSGEHRYFFEAMYKCDVRYVVADCYCHDNDDAYDTANEIVASQHDRIVATLKSLIKPVSHEELAESIVDSLRYYEEENCYCDLTFKFAAPSIYTSSQYYQPLKQLRMMFESLGYQPRTYDTIKESFNLNQDWWIVRCPKCIRDYGYALPVSNDIDTLASITELVYNGAVQFVVYDNDNNELL